MPYNIRFTTFKQLAKIKVDLRNEEPLKKIVTSSQGVAFLNIKTKLKFLKYRIIMSTI